MPEPKWTQHEFPDGIWWICNECNSWDAHGQRRLWKCRASGVEAPKNFNLCDGGKQHDATVV